MLFSSWMEVEENSGMAAGFAKLFALTRGLIVTKLAFVSQELRDWMLPLFRRAESLIIYGYETLRDIVLKMEKSKLVYACPHEGADN